MGADSASPTRARSVAMVGAGQLARMTHQAAIDLDVELVVMATDPAEPAVSAGAPYELGSASSLADLERLAVRAAVTTFDHELVPTAQLRELQRRGHCLRPGPEALVYAQDKLFARSALAAAGFPVPRFERAASAAEVRAFAASVGWPLVLKAPTGGYDGRGVFVRAGDEELDWFFDDPERAGRLWLVEEHLRLERELAVIVARRPAGETLAYPLVETLQAGGICTRLVMPADVPDDVTAAALALGTAVAEEIGAVGICAVELFLETSGRLAVNECALRPHNSGHATIEACTTSQFHQHLRAVLDWPLGDPALVVPAAATVNLLGGDDAVDPALLLSAAETVPGTAVHLYAKVPRPGRKLGHVTAVAATTGEALRRAELAAARLGG